MWAHWGSEQGEELRYQVTYHTYLASEEQLLHTPSVETVVEQYARLGLFILNFFAVEYVMLT